MKTIVNPFISIILIFGLNLPALQAQVGINTRNPQTALHIDGAGDNNVSGLPTATQESNDVAITASDEVGIGTITPSAKLEINSGTPGESGLKFSKVDSNTPATTNSTSKLGVDNNGNVVSHSPKYSIGDVKSSLLTTDHNGWYLLDGRAVNTLSANAQNSASSIGFTTNIPDAKDRVLKTKSTSEVIGDIGGINSSTLTQANLPAVSININISGSTSTAGQHQHLVQPGTGFLLSGTFINNPGYWNTTARAPCPAAWGGVGAGATNVLGAHTHAISGTATISTGGSNVPLDNRQKSLIVNTFIYLGG